MESQLAFARAGAGARRGAGQYDSRKNKPTGCLTHYSRSSPRLLTLIGDWVRQGLRHQQGPSTLSETRPAPVRAHSNRIRLRLADHPISSDHSKQAMAIAKRRGRRYRPSRKHGKDKPMPGSERAVDTIKSDAQRPRPPFLQSSPPLGALSGGPSALER